MFQGWKLVLGLWLWRMMKVKPDFVAAWGRKHSAEETRGGAAIALATQAAICVPGLSLSEDPRW